MDYARYDNQAASASWNPDQTVPQQIMQPQPQQLQPPTQVIKSDPQHPQHPQAQPIVYGAPPAQHQPMTTYDMSVNWSSPQMVPQNVIQVPQWPTTGAPIGHTVAIDPICPPPITDPCIHSTAHSQQQSHYTQYSTLPAAPSTYWNNTDLVNNGQPAALVGPPPSTTSALSTGLSAVDEPNDPALIDNPFTLNQPSAIQPAGLADGTVGVPIPQPSARPQPPPQPQQLQHPQPHLSLSHQFDDQLTMGTSSHVGQIPSSVAEGPGSLEDALEVIKSHAEHFSSHRQTCSSTSGDDDDDDHSRGPRSGEREKERRQANNARER